ncbi:MAG TPA: tryptophan 7-halogenase, partial [Cellvibrio sp.]
SNLESEAIGEPNFIKFLTGRRRKQWNRNVVAIGLSSGFLEPLESTSIHLIQSAVVRLIKFFPHRGIDPDNIAEYNRQSTIEYEQIRDFIILHYFANERNDSQFWIDMRNLDVPISLKRKVDVYRATGNIFRDQDDLFVDSSWLQVMLGQGIEPKDYHPIANQLGDEQLKTMLKDMQKIKRDVLLHMPTHDDFLSGICG